MILAFFCKCSKYSCVGIALFLLLTSPQSCVRSKKDRLTGKEKFQFDSLGDKKILNESLKQSDTSRSWLGVQTNYSPNGTIVKRFWIVEKDQIPYSVYNDTVDIEGKMIDVLTGIEINYHENGKIMSKGMIVNAKRIGYWYYYGAEGKFLKAEYYPCLSKSTSTTF